MITEEYGRKFEAESKDGEKITIRQIDILADISSLTEGPGHRKTNERFETKDGKKVNRNKDGSFEVVSTGKIYYEKTS